LSYWTKLEEKIMTQQIDKYGNTTVMSFSNNDYIRGNTLLGQRGKVLLSIIIIIIIITIRARGKHNWWISNENESLLQTL
jgi:hypothetical protein